MDKPVVSIIRCEDYGDPDLNKKVRGAVEKVLDIREIIKTGVRVLLKVNLLYGTAPGRAVTTHPAIVRAAGELVRDCGGEILIGDSSGFGSTPRNLKLSGIEPVAKKLGAKIIPFTEPVSIDIPELRYARNLKIEKAVLEADVIVNLPKLKTHGLTYFTGAAKNLFGCVPGLQKGKAHVRLPDAGQFSAMLVELNRVIKPQLNLMDAIVGMEGWGPGSGDPKKVGLLLAGDNTFATDVVACEIIGQPVSEVPYIRQAAEQGLGPASAADIEIRGEKLDEVKVPGFRLRPQPGGFRKLQNYLMARAGDFLRQAAFEVPVLKRKKCTSCFRCVEVCPAGIISKSRRGPVFNRKKCVRCYCCQEMCPQGAIALKRRLLP